MNGLVLDKSPHALHYRYWLDDEPVGEAQLHSDGWVWGVEIYATFRGNGPGRQLMEAIEIHARASAMPSLRLWVAHGNEIAERMYAGLGYRATHSTERGVCMQKDLT